MKIFIKGIWYDTNKVSAVLALSHKERILISQMDVDAKYFGSFPDIITDDGCREILKQARERDKKGE